MLRSVGTIFIALITLIIFSGSGYAEGKLALFVSVAPQKYFVQQIGKDLVQVHVMVQPGANPATYEPKPRQMADLSKAKAYFAIGVPFEAIWLKKIAAANPEMKVIHTEQGIKRVPMATHHHNEEHDAHAAKTTRIEAGPSHHADEHGHGGLDPHIWLSPPLVKIQARTILTALQTLDPLHEGEYQANYHEFTAEIDELDHQLKQTLAGRQGLRFIVFHPAWGYFAHAYGLEQVPIEIEGKDPKPAQLEELIKEARKADIKVVFVQPQFSAKSARLVAKAIDGQVVFADPLAGDWAVNLRLVADKFKSALR
ncbi:MAG: zinc ABC transporter substrate-binding protein [Desulfosarcinaceae bacterium]